MDLKEVQISEIKNLNLSENGSRFDVYFGDNLY